MKTYKFLVAGLAALSLLTASVASAQVASTTTSTSTTVGVSGPDLAVSIGSNGITLSAVNSSQPIRVTGLPFSIGGGIGGTCQLMNGSANLGTVGVTGANNSVNFAGSGVTVPAGQAVILGVSCTGATPGSYPVTLQTSLIPAIVDGTSQSITPRGIGGGSDNDTTAVGTLTINSSGAVGGISGGTSGGTTTGSTGGTTTGSTGGTTTGTSGSTGSTGGAVLGTSTSVPNVPNTGAGGDWAINLILLALAGAAAVSGAAILRRHARA